MSSSVDQQLLIIWILFVIALLMMGGVFFFNYWLQKQRNSLCPYSQAPLRSGEQLSLAIKEKVLVFLYRHRSFDNQLFPLRTAGFSRETGRLFPHAMTWYGIIKVDWSFLQKRRQGHYVSWGSLSREQQNAVLRMHGSLKGFQTDYSSSTSSPRAVEQCYASCKPGPLYVDVNTNVVMGWKCVPDTDCEVLIVQHPRQIIGLSSQQK